MAVEAPISKFKKKNILIYIAVLLIFGLWFAYDGYVNQSFMEKHTDADGNPNSTLVFNQRAPFFLLPAAIALGVYYFAIKDKKIVADDEKIVLPGNKEIAFENIVKVDKTHFESKGWFTITYKEQHMEHDLKISDRKYDHTPELLDLIVAKIS